jgi:hypothetical protein
MLEAWLERGIRRSSMRRLIAAAALLAAYAYWLFARQSPWAAPFSLLGAEMPELIAGFPAQEPAAALNKLSLARGDYLWVQAFDLPFVVLAALVATTAIAIGLKRLDLSHSDGRYLLLAPALYVALECVENALLALFASGLAEPTRALSLAQQTATVGKLAALIVAAALAIAGILAWAGAVLVRFVRRST